MNFKIKYLAFLLVVTGLFFQSCSDTTVNDTPDKTAKVQVKLVDFPGEYQQVNVNIIEVLYRIVPEEEMDSDTHEDVEWTIFESFEGPMEVNLIALTGGVSEILAEEVLDPGFLTQIRLVLGDGNEIVVDGEEFPLQTPSAQQSGLKIKINTLLEAGFSYNIVLDWDVQKSIVKTGNGKYILKPVIRAALEANSGIIEGVIKKEIETETLIEGSDPAAYETVITYETVASQTVYLFKKSNDVFEFDGDSLTSTETNESGMCRFEGVEPGTYKIVYEYEDDTDQNNIVIIKYASEEITISEGGEIFSGDENGEIILTVIE